MNYVVFSVGRQVAAPHAKFARLVCGFGFRDGSVSAGIPLRSSCGGGGWRSLQGTPKTPSGNLRERAGDLLPVLA